MPQSLDFFPYIRMPFKVTAIEVTENNIKDLCNLVGDGKLRSKDNGRPYFLADRRLIRNIIRVEVGYWVTKLDDVYRIYRPELFQRLFWEATPVRDRLFELMFVNEIPDVEEEVAANDL